MLSNTFYLPRFLILSLAIVLTGCTATPQTEAPPQYAKSPGYQSKFGGPTGSTASPSGSAIKIGQAQIIQAQQAHSQKCWVTVQAMVLKLLPDDTHPPRHQRFLLKLDNGTTVLVAHNTDLAPSVPIAPGNVVTIHGEYIWNEKGGLIHWTHHDPQGREEGGWIDYNGQLFK